MSEKRIARLNSLLKEVISDVIHHEVKNPHLPAFVTVTHVEVAADLSFAKVFVSVIEDAMGPKAVEVLTKASGFIATMAAKKVTLRYFPELRFILDLSLQYQGRVDELLRQVDEERQRREPRD